MFKHWPLYGYNKDWDYQVNFATLWSFEDFMEKAFKYHTFPFFQISVKKFVPAQIVVRCNKYLTLKISKVLKL